MKSVFLKIFASLAFAAVVFPLMFSFDINTYGNISAPRMLFYYGIGAVIFAVGYTEAALAKVHRKLRIPLRIAGCLTFGAGFLSLAIGGDGVSVFIFGCCCVFAFFIGERAGYKNFADMFPLTAFALYIVMTVACYIFVRVAANEDINAAASDTVVAAFAIEFAAAALLVNQSGIFDRANMRKETRSSLPTSLTAYNAALVLGFTVTALALCVFRKPLAWAVEQAIIIVIKAIIFIWQLFSAEPMDTESSESGEVGSGLWFTSEESYLLEAFTIFALIAIAVIFRRNIANAVKSFFAWLGRLFSGRPEESVRPEFTDVFENYSSGRARRSQSDNIYAVRRKYKSEKDPSMKFRYGYQILLFRIKAVNQRLMPSDTVSVQAQRGAERFGQSQMSDVAQTYERIRYGSLSPAPQQLAALNELVEKP